MIEEILGLSRSFLNDTIQKTFIKDTRDYKETFSHVREQLASIAEQEHQIVISWWKKCSNLGSAAMSVDSLNDMVKIVWRMVKDQGGEGKRMLCFFLMGISAILAAAGKRISQDEISSWRMSCVKWLGTQLTIGGKGVETGEGEGSTIDRIGRFFNTPYLHDFD